MSKGKNSDKQVPVFSSDNFFKENEYVYIHLSTEFPKFVGVLHQHEFIEVVYVLSGSAIHQIGNRSYTVKRGDVVVINCNVPHKFTGIPDCKDSFITYDLMFTPDFFDASAIHLGDFESLKNSFLFYSLFPAQEPLRPDMHLDNSGYTDYGELFTKIYHEYGMRRKGCLELIRAYVIELIIKIFRDLEQNFENKLSINNIAAVHAAVRYITDNYSLDLTVDSLASHAFLNPDYFRKLFKQVTGLSVSSYWQKTRIDEACRLLLTTDLAIKEIAQKCGYNDLKNFYKNFKKVTDKTPGQYRKNQ